MKLISKLISSFLLILVFISCQQKEAKEIETTTKEKEPFKVGVILPLSGPLQEFGVAVKNGIALAKKNDPEHLKNVKFIFEDSQYVAQMAISAFHKLRNTEKVNLIFNWGNPTSEAISPIAERLKIPVLALLSNSHIAKDKNFLIRTQNSDYAFSKKLGEYIKSKQYKRIGIVRTENSYLNGMYDGLKKYLKDDVLVDIVNTYNFTDNDFKNSILKIKHQNYPAVGVFLLSGQISLFYKQLKQLDVGIDTFGTDFLESTTEIKNSGSSIQGAVYSYLNASKDFHAQYLQEYKNDLQIAHAGNAYDMAVMLNEVFQEKTSDPEKIMEKLRTKKQYNGVSGTFTYTEDAGDKFFKFPVKLKRVEGDGWVVIE